MNLNALIKTARLSWREHKGVQVATMVVLTATFTIVISFLSLSSNMRNILRSWGESVQLTAYLKDGLSERDVASVDEALQAVGEFKKITYVSKEEAKSKFSQQMASYAPNLLSDGALGNPFPASFEMAFVEQKSVEGLALLAQQISKVSGVEEVTYGQDWVQNYSQLVSVFKWTSWGVALILIFGSFFVVANSIRASIDRRRDEIEIYKLVGASDSAIRAPFVFEGAMMGGAATAFALIISYGFYFWQLQIVTNSLAFTGVSSHFHFLPFTVLVLVLFGGVAIGALGSYLCVFRVGSLLQLSKGT